jgi:hypothetical protein
MRTLLLKGVSMSRRAEERVECLRESEGKEEGKKERREWLSLFRGAQNTATPPCAAKL